MTAEFVGSIVIASVSPCPSISGWIGGPTSSIDPRAIFGGVPVGENLLLTVSASHVALGTQARGRDSKELPLSVEPQPMPATDTAPLPPLLAVFPEPLEFPEPAVFPDPAEAAEPPLPEPAVNPGASPACPSCADFAG